MRSATMAASGSAALMVTAWPSSMPSAVVSLTILLLRCGSSASLIRPALQSCQVSPPSVLRITPLISSAAKISSGLFGCWAKRITRDAKGPLQWLAMTGVASLRQLVPPSSLR